MRVIERCDTAVGLFIARNPSAPETRAAEVQAGADLADLIAHAVNIGALGEDDLPDLRVYVDGESVPFATFEEKVEALDLVPAAGSMVNLQVEPAGGSNSSARTALTVILTAVAVVAAFTVGPFTAALWQLGAAIVPQLTFPIKAPDTLAGPNDQGALNSAANQRRLRGMMPLQLGEGRAAFDVAANAYSSIINGEVWLTVIFGVHYGPCSIRDYKIGETLLSDYPAEDVQIEEKLLPGERIFSLYAQSVSPQPMQDELDLGGAGEVHTTAEQCERVEVDLTWPQGLSFRKDSGSIVQQETRCKIEWAPVGSDSWSAAPIENGPFSDRLGAALPVGTVDVMAKTQDPVRRTFSWTKGNADQIKVRVTAWDPEGDDATKATQTVFWTDLRSIVFKQPIVDQNLACVAFRIKSSDDLGGTLPTVTGVVTPHAPVYDSETGVWDDDLANWAPTANHAAHVRMLLMAPAAAKPADPDEWGDSFGDVYDLIEERGWKGSYRLDREASQEDALKILGAMGRFSAYDAGEGLVLVPDWEKPVARQIFTGRNVENYSYTRTFPDPCHAVVVEFQNIDEDGKADEVIIYAEGFSAYGSEATEDEEATLPATLLETIRLDWQATGDRATKEGYVFLAKRNISVEAHEWTAGPSAIAASYGARVKLRHYSALYGAGEGRVQFRHFSGGLVSGVRLDDEVEMVEGETYALDVQRTDRIIPGMLLVTTPGRTRDLMFPVALAPEDAPEADDTVAFGRTDVVTEDLEIVDFSPSGDQVQISARKYIGPELVAAETGDIPEFTTKLTPTARAPRPRLLGITAASPDGVKIAFDVAEVRGALIESFPVRWRRSTSDTDENPWQILTPLAANQRLAITPPFPDAASAGQDPESAYKVDVEIRSKLRSGDVSAPLLVTDIQVSRLVKPPTGFAAAGVKRTAADGSSYPALTVSANAITSGLEQDLIVEIRPAGGSDTSWKSAGQPLAASNPIGDFTAVTSGSLLDTRAQWRTSDNWTSEWVEISDVLIPLNALISAGVTTIGGLTPAELVAAFEATVDQGRELTRATLELSLRAIEERGQLITETFHNGVRVKRILINDDQTWDDGDKSFWERMSLMAILADDGLSMIVQHDTLMWSPTESYATHVEGIRTQIGTDIATATESIHTWVDEDSAGSIWIRDLEVAFGLDFIGSITETTSIVSGIGGTYTLAFDINGHASGFRLANDGSLSSMVFLSDEIGFANNAGDVVYPLSIVGSIVRATNFEADMIKANTITADRIIGGEITDSVFSSSGSTYGLSIGSWTTVRTINYTSIGGRLQILSQATVEAVAPSDAYFGFQIVVDGSVLDDWPKRVLSGDYAREFALSNWTPSAGAHTIEYQILLYGGSGAGNSLNQLLYITEYKTEH
jgi:hypothetical protein